MAQKTRELPKAKLEDLEVREVSLVDRPANRRRFLIVKRRSDMPRAAIPASEAEAMALRKQSLEAEPAAADDVSFFDILGIGEVAAAPDGDAPGETSTEPTEGEPAAETPEDHAEGAPDVETPAEGESAPENEPQPEADPEPEPAESEEPTVEDPSPDPVQKGPELLDQAVGLLQRLTAEVSALKDAPELSSEAEAEIAKLANDIAAAAGAELGDVEKSDATPIQVATEAVEKLIGVVSALQGAGDEVPESVCPDMIGVAKALAALVKVEPGPEPEQGAEPEPAAESDTFDLSTLLEIEKAEGPEGEGDDPMLVIKAGAKMRKARLTQFEQAVTVLQGILSELKGIPAAGGTEKVSKHEGTSVVATVATMLDGIKTSMAARLAGIQKAVDGVVARVERIESVRPEGNGAVDPTPIKKADPNDDSNPDFWSGVL